MSVSESESECVRARQCERVSERVERVQAGALSRSVDGYNDVRREIQRLNLDLTVLYVPCSLDSGLPVTILKVVPIPVTFESLCFLRSCPTHIRTCPTRFDRVTECAGGGALAVGRRVQRCAP